MKRSIRNISYGFRDFNEEIDFIVQHDDIVKISPQTIVVNKNETITLVIKALGAGHSEIYANETNRRG